MLEAVLMGKPIKGPMSSIIKFDVTVGSRLGNVAVTSDGKRVVYRNYGWKANTSPSVIGFVFDLIDDVWEVSELISTVVSTYIYDLGPIDISSNGETIVVGNYALSSNGGIVHVFRKIEGEWRIVYTAPTGGEVGRAVSVSPDGNKVAFNRKIEIYNNNCNVTVLTRVTDTSWSSVNIVPPATINNSMFGREGIKFTSNTNLFINDIFVDIPPANNAYEGRAHFYQLVGSSWVSIQTINNPIIGYSSQFSRYFAFSEDGNVFATFSPTSSTNNRLWFFKKNTMGKFEMVHQINFNSVQTLISISLSKDGSKACLGVRDTTVKQYPFFHVFDSTDLLSWKSSKAVLLDELGLGLNSWNGFSTQMYEYGGEDYLAASIYAVNGRQLGAAVALIDV